MSGRYLSGRRITLLMLLVSATVLTAFCYMDNYATFMPLFSRNESLISQQLPGFGSGKVDEADLPWIHNTRFLRSIMEHDVPVLLAAFRIVINNPVSSEMENIKLTLERLNGTIVEPDAVFSFNQALGPFTKENGYLPGPNYINNRLVITEGGGVCKIATMLYNLTVLTDLPVVFRKPHSMVVPYVTPGRDAAVSYTSELDFRFRNNTPHPLLIWGEQVGQVIYMAFYGREQAPDVEWHQHILSYTPAPTITRKTTSLPTGKVRVTRQGFDGYVVRSWVEITYPDKSVKSKPLGISRYRMIPRLVDQGQ